MMDELSHADRIDIVKLESLHHDQGFFYDIKSNINADFKGAKIEDWGEQEPLKKLMSARPFNLQPAVNSAEEWNGNLVPAMKSTSITLHQQPANCSQLSNFNGNSPRPKNAAPFPYAMHNSNNNNRHQSATFPKTQPNRAMSYSMLLQSNESNVNQGTVHWKSKEPRNGLFPDVSSRKKLACDSNAKECTEKSHCNRLFPCPKCIKVFKRGDHLKRHLLSVHDQDHPYQCGDCSKGFASVQSLTRHSESSHALHCSMGHLCVRCKIRFNSTARLAKHAKHNHELADAEYMREINETSRTYSCQLCEKTVSSERNLKRHVEKLHGYDVTDGANMKKNGEMKVNNMAMHPPTHPRAPPQLGADKLMGVGPVIRETPFAPQHHPQPFINHHMVKMEPAGNHHKMEPASNHHKMEPSPCFIEQIEPFHHPHPPHQHKPHQLPPEALHHLPPPHNHPSKTNTPWNEHTANKTAFLKRVSAPTLPPSTAASHDRTTARLMELNGGRHHHVRPITTNPSDGVNGAPTPPPRPSSVSEAFSLAMRTLSEPYDDEFQPYPTSFDTGEFPEPPRAVTPDPNCWNFTSTPPPPLQIRSAPVQPDHHSMSPQPKLKKPRPKANGGAVVDVPVTSPVAPPVVLQARRGRPKKNKGVEKEEMILKDVVNGGTTNFNCTVCLQVYEGIDNLMLHLENVHLVMNPHECCMCHKRFAQAGNVKRHIRFVHLRERPFRCRDCHSTFDRLCYLQRHMRQHADSARDSPALSLLQPCNCPECGKRCLTHHHMRGHMQRKHFAKKLQRDGLMRVKYDHLFRAGAGDADASSNSNQQRTSTKNHNANNNGQMSRGQTSHQHDDDDGETSTAKRSLRKRARSALVYRGKARRGKFKCQTCGRGHRSLQLLASHERAQHGGEHRRIVCLLCGVRFASFQALKSHVARHRTPPNHRLTPPNPRKITA